MGWILFNVYIYYIHPELEMGDCHSGTEKGAKLLLKGSSEKAKERGKKPAKKYEEAVREHGGATGEHERVSREQERAQREHERASREHMAETGLNARAKWRGLSYIAAGHVLA